MDCAGLARITSAFVESRILQTAVLLGLFDTRHQPAAFCGVAVRPANRYQGPHPGRDPDLKMATRFCASCGAKLVVDANFCVECGERLPGVKVPRPRWSFPVHRYAPLLVVLTIVAVGGGAVVFGVLAPKSPPSVPGRDAPQAPVDTGGKLPEGHPPIAIPEQVKQAIRELAKKAEAAPDDLDSWKHLAEVEYRAGQLDPSYLPEAALAYKHVLEREPDNLDVIRNLGNIAFDQDQQGIAIGYYQQYLQRKPDDLNVQTDLGTMYLSDGKADEAIATYDKVLKADPAFFQAQFNLAIAYRSMGQTDKAVAALDKARTLATDDKTRNQVDQLAARLKGQPPPGHPGVAQPGVGQEAPAPAPAPPVVAAGAPPAGSFQADAEAIFRQNQVLGPKVQRIEWPGPESAKVYLRGFPMDQMPPEMRSMFTDRMKGRIKEQKEAHQIASTTHFELVDEATGKVMDTITE
jgi:cytochrome c-type biogenesis protein CcmH/NrfG